MLRVYNKHIYDYLVDVLIKNIKHLNSLHDGSIGLQISPFIYSKNVRDSFLFFGDDDQIISFVWEQVVEKNHQIEESTGFSSDVHINS